MWNIVWETKVIFINNAAPLLAAHMGWSALFWPQFKATSDLGKNMLWLICKSDTAHKFFSIIWISLHRFWVRLLTPVLSSFWFPPSSHFICRSPRYLLYIILLPCSGAERPESYFFDRPLTFSLSDVSHYFLPSLSSFGGCSLSRPCQPVLPSQLSPRFLP